MGSSIKAVSTNSLVFIKPNRWGTSSSQTWFHWLVYSGFYDTRSNYQITDYDINYNDTKDIKNNKNKDTQSYPKIINCSSSFQIWPNARYSLLQLGFPPNKD